MFFSPWRWGQKILRRPMNMKQVSWILAGALLLLVCNAVGATRGAAQVPTTVVNGIVTDTRGAAISGAAVSATHLATGVLRQTSSNTDGVYAIPDLPAGSYD